MTSAVEAWEKAAALCGRIGLLDEVAGDEVELTAGLLEPLGSFVGADMGVLRVFSLAHAETRPRVYTRGVPDSVNDAYLTHYYRLDPGRQILRERLSAPLYACDRPPGVWFRESSVEGMPEARGTGSYQRDFVRYRREFLLPNRLYHHLGFCFQDADGSRTLLFSFHRVTEGAPFGRVELARVHIVATLLQAKFALLRDIDEGGGGHDAPCLSSFSGRLGTREREVAEAVALGLTNKEVAARLQISVRTVENHMRSIFAKLGVTSRTRLAAKLHGVRRTPAVTSISVV